MAEPIFVDGVPERIGLQYFRRRFGQNFPTLLREDYNELLQTAVEDTYTDFSGVKELWSDLDRQTYFDKTQLCYSLLVAWWIADMYPKYAVGIPTSSGIPIHSKVIGGVKIVFGSPNDNTSARKGYADLLAPLKSNPFGYKAYQMIVSSSVLRRMRTSRRN